MTDRNRPLRAGRLARRGLAPSAALTAVQMATGPITRTYHLAPSPGAPAPVLVVLHGAGGAGPGTAAMTGLAERGPAAGFTTVFPDGVRRVWNDGRTGARTASRQDVDDTVFVLAIVDRLVDIGWADGPGFFVCGMSNGAFLSEHLARVTGRVRGLGLVAGTATEAGRVGSDPASVQPTPVVMFHGTADPLVPYGGGPIGPLGRLVARRAGRGATDGARGRCLGAVRVAADWAAVNGDPPTPVVEQIRVPAGALAVERSTWCAAGHQPVVLHTVQGGGHVWPGAAPYLPARLVGATARHLDATGILLDTFARAAGRTGT